jgi:hyperosmotically inducible periplasmic protein
MNFKYKCAAALLSASVVVMSAAPAWAADETTAAPTKSTQRAANRQLAKAVQSKLYKTKGLVSDDVHAVARSGTVTLVGQAPTQEQIDLAGKVAQGVSGVTTLKNNLTVDEPGK